MKGDFSHWNLNPAGNLSGVLQQQGKVLLDRDWNEQTRLTGHWQDLTGRDVIGPGVAAVPLGDSDGFAIVQAAVTTGADGVDRVEVHATPGHIWADGIVCYLSGDTADPTAPVMRVADYLQPPIQDPPGSVASIGAGIRDVVILEVSREALNAFQVPDELIEPALGGPDTTERILTRMAFKLFRLAPGEDCMSIRDRLDDDAEGKGRLTVQLQPTEEIPGDCPVVLGGGYSGFEHFLYRIEIAALDSGTETHFKWSQFNGGLVGRGELLTAPNRIRVTANRTAIVNSGLNEFYCEIVTFDETRGVWNVTYGTDVTLADGELHVATERLGSFASSTDTVFFRLWNGIAPVSGFTSSADPVELLDGIQLVFDPSSDSNYAPGDYWNFKVRAGEAGNPEVLVGDEPPAGPDYHRVPLAEITWGDPPDTSVAGEIEDCRRRFRPLTRLDTCCTYRVGDGVRSHGDFDSIQAAIDALPERGGEVCVLPGVYQESVLIENRHNITISGCGTRTLIRANPPEEGTLLAVPAIHVRGGGALTIESLAVEAHATGVGILLEGASYLDDSTDLEGSLVGASLRQLLVLGGIQGAVRAVYANDLTIQGCNLHQRDAAGLAHILAIRSDDAEIADNTIQVALEEGDLTGTAGGAWSPTPYTEPGALAPGGIHILGLSERVRITGNLIRGGSGHGITLGSLLFFSETGEPLPGTDDKDVEEEVDPCAPTREVPPIFTPKSDTGGDQGTIIMLPDGPIEDLMIERNRILQMGICGIGVIWFFDLSAVDAFITVRRVSILGNTIQGNMRRPVAELPANLINVAGLGGIALADVEYLLVRDNVIGSNGPTHLEAICGVFVLHGEGVEISRNVILDNGHKDTPSAEGAKRGRRGGIVLVYALAPTRMIQLPGAANAGTLAPAQNGVPAASIHDNIVVQPLGQALIMNALGAVSVVGNQFTSQGVFTGFTTSFLAATVAITNLGLSNELYLQYLAFRSVGSSKTVEATAAAGRSGFDDAGLGRALANGIVQFSDNQVTLDVVESGVSLAMTSVMILTLDDLGFSDNQCVANLLDDFVLSHALLFGLSTRAADNRFTEGVFNALLSAMTLGLFMNTTVHNQGTHCILAAGLHTIRFPNTTLVAGVEESEDDTSQCLAVLRKIAAGLAALSSGKARAATVRTVGASGSNLINRSSS